MIARRAQAEMENSISSDSGQQATGSSESAYQFTLWLCELADRVAAAVKQHTPAAFRYRGADLERAFKRAAYFLLVNDEQAHEVFLAERRGRPAPALHDAAASTELLREYLQGGDPAGAGTVALDPVGRLLGAAARIGGALRARGPLWALAIQPKFVDHLLPIVQAAGAPVRFVTFDDPVTEAHVRKAGLRVLNAGAGTQTLTRSRRSTGLGLVHSHALAFDALWRLMRAQRPAGVLLSEGNAPVYDIANEAARLLGIPTLCVQQGWSPIVHTGFRDLRFGSMAVWGEWFAAALAPFNPRQRFAVLGNHQIGLAGPKARRPQSVGFFLQRGSRLISEADWQGMLGLVEYAATSLDGARVLVRDHPNAPLTPAELDRLLAHATVRHAPPGAVSLHAALEECDIVVSIFSTTILEAIGAGAMPLIVNVTSMPTYYPDVAAEGAAIEVKDFAAARAALAGLWSSGAARHADALERMQRRLFAAAGADALRRIAAHLREEFRLG